MCVCVLEFFVRAFICRVEKRFDDYRVNQLPRWSVSWTIYAFSSRELARGNRVAVQPADRSRWDRIPNTNDRLAVGCARAPAPCTGYPRLQTARTDRVINLRRAGVDASPPLPLPSFFALSRSFSRTMRRLGGFETRFSPVLTYRPVARPVAAVVPFMTTTCILPGSGLPTRVRRPEKHYRSSHHTHTVVCSPFECN